MRIEEFLAEIFVDFYEQMMLATNQVASSEEFDTMFYEDDSEEQMSDIEFVEKYCDEICDEEIIDGVYYYLIDDGCDFDFSIEKIVSHFVMNYIYENYNDPKLSPIMRYLKSNDIKSVTELFVSNEAFGKSFIESYLRNYDSEIDYDSVKETITNNGDEELLTKWVNLSSDYCSLNELLRRVLVSLYDYYISHGCGDIDAINNVWGYFTNNFDPLGELDNMGMDYETKQKCKAYMLRVIYSDLYEDISNGPIIDSVNEYDNITNSFVLASMKMGLCRLPLDVEVRNRMMKHFLLLHYEKEKRIENRRATLKEGRGEVLKKVHPGHILDTIDFAKK